MATTQLPPAAAATTITTPVVVAAPEAPQLPPAAPVEAARGSRLADGEASGASPPHDDDGGEFDFEEGGDKSQAGLFELLDQVTPSYGYLNLRTSLSRTLKGEG